MTYGPRTAADSRPAGCNTPFKDGVVLLTMKLSSPAVSAEEKSVSLAWLGDHWVRVRSRKQTVRNPLMCLAVQPNEWGGVNSVASQEMHESARESLCSVLCCEHGIYVRRSPSQPLHFWCRKVGHRHPSSGEHDGHDDV